MENDNKVSRRSLLAGLASAAFALPSVAALAGAGRAAKWNEKFELAIDLEIKQATSVRWHRPYVAVWIEDQNGNPIRTLSLWVQKTGRGPRWIPDLRRWFRSEEKRKQAKGDDLVATVGSATRIAGKYSLVWNGRDDAQKLVDQGEYYLCIEAAREHGTYQIIRESLTIGTKPFTKKFDENVEIGSAVAEFRKRK